MAYSEELAERVRDAVDGRPGVTERKMFGGIAWAADAAADFAESLRRSDD